MIFPEQDATRVELEQLAELIEALLIAQAANGSTPEIESQLSGLLLRQTDIQRK